jgi:cell wall assembly regulator SMI1
VRRVANSWKLIRARFKEHAHSTFLALRPPATKTAIAKLERSLGVKLPAAVRQSYLIHDGMTDAGWPTLSNYHHLLPLQNVAGQYRITMSNPWDDPNPRKLGDKGRIKTDLRWREKWVPLLDEAGGDLIGLDLDPGPEGTRGQLFRWANYGSPAPYVIAASFAEYLDRLATELEHYRFTFTDYGALQLKDDTLG